MDMKLRKILRDFINWQGSKNLLKNPYTIDYELAEAYLEDTGKQLKLYDVSKRYHHEICGKATLIKEYEHSVYGTMLMVKPLKQKDIFFAPKREFTELPFS